MVQTKQISQIALIGLAAIAPQNLALRLKQSAPVQPDAEKIDGWMRRLRSEAQIEEAQEPVLALQQEEREPIRKEWKEGDEVEVFSKSQQAWCLGTIDKLGRGKQLHTGTDRWAQPDGEWFRVQYIKPGTPRVITEWYDRTEETIRLISEEEATRRRNEEGRRAKEIENKYWQNFYIEEQCAKDVTAFFEQVKTEIVQENPASIVEILNSGVGERILKLARAAYETYESRDSIKVKPLVEICAQEQESDVIKPLVEICAQQLQGDKDIRRAIGQICLSQDVNTADPQEVDGSSDYMKPKQEIRMAMQAIKKHEQYQAMQPCKGCGTYKEEGKLCRNEDCPSYERGPQCCVM